jgi:uncharacterized membrane protein
MLTRFNRKGFKKVEILISELSNHLGCMKKRGFYIILLGCFNFNNDECMFMWIIVGKLAVTVTVCLQDIDIMD